MKLHQTYNFQPLIDMLELLAVPVATILSIGIIFSVLLYLYFKNKNPKKNISIELNGIANMHMLVSHHMNYLDENVQLSKEDHKFLMSMNEQLKLTEKYFLAVIDSVNSNSPVPYWHEIKTDPEKFKTMKERLCRKK